MRRLVLVLVALAALAVPVTASAHPLGNFTVNRFSRIEVSGPRVYVIYVLDLAEIPTFQAGTIDPQVYARRIAQGIALTVDGRRAPLRPGETALAHPAGAAGLRTTRLEVVLRGPQLASPASIGYRDRNFADRIGWKEIVVGRDTPSVSDELRAYPKDLLQSPLHVTAVHTRLVPGSEPGTRPVLTHGRALQAPDRIADSGFASLVARRHLGVWVIVVSLVAALFWGAAHALSPGHGKTIVAAYLVGRRGTPRHAVLLGLIVTVTHTIGVFALGLVTLLLSRFIVPEQLYPWLNLVAGLLVVTIGAAVLRTRWRQRRLHDHHHHHHDLSRRSLIAVGISGGMLPCPSALVVLLAAISLHRVGYGLVLILAFSVGLAAAVTSIGLLAVTAKRVFIRLDFEAGAVRLLPAVSAFVILGFGLLMTLRALPGIV